MASQEEPPSSPTSSSLARLRARIWLRQMEEDDVPRTSSTSSIPRQVPTVLLRPPDHASSHSHPHHHPHHEGNSSGTMEDNGNGQGFVDDDNDDYDDQDNEDDDNSLVVAVERQQLKYLICGAVAGAVSRTCTAPLDRLKVLMQTQVSQPRSAPRSMAASIRASLGNLALATNAIYADGGVRSFWRGNGMNCVKIVPESAIKFYVFEQAKRAVAIFQGCDPDDPETNIGIAGRFVAGGAGGLCSQFSIYPIETLKTRVMAATHATSVPSSSSRASLGSAVTTFTSSTTTAAAPAATGSTVPRQVPPRSAIHLAAVPSRAMASLAAVAASPPRPVDPSGLIVSTARDMWREGGWRAFFRGLGPSLIGIVPYAGIDLAMYETLKGTYARMHPPATPGALSPEGYAAPPPTPPVMWLLIFGTISGSIGATAVYPLSLIRTRLQAQGSAGHPERYSGAMDVVRKTYQRESLRGFYKGLAPSLIKVIPAASISYACYEGMKTLVGL